MTEFNIQTFINGEEITQTELDRLKYERTLHVLHELLDLGVDITDESGKPLTNLALNWLEPQAAIDLLVKEHTKLGPQGTLDLYKDILLDSDKRWHDYNQEPIEKQGLQKGTTHLLVSGIDPKSFASAMGGAATGDTAFRINPEHFYVKGDVTTGKQEVMETFGMTGEPTLTYGEGSQQIPDYFQVKRLEDHPLCLAGESFLLHDDFNIHVGAVHQIKPLPNGIDIVSTYVCPNNAPQAISKNHTVHFALELGGLFNLLHEAQKNN